MTSRNIAAIVGLIALWLMVPTVHSQSVTAQYIKKYDFSDSETKWTEWNVLFTNTSRSRVIVHFKWAEEEGTLGAMTDPIDPGKTGYGYSKAFRRGTEPSLTYRIENADATTPPSSPRRPSTTGGVSNVPSRSGGRGQGQAPGTGTATGTGASTGTTPPPPPTPQPRIMPQIVQPRPDNPNGSVEIGPLTPRVPKPPTSRPFQPLQYQPICEKCGWKGRIYSEGQAAPASLELVRHQGQEHRGIQYGRIAVLPRKD